MRRTRMVLLFTVLLYAVKGKEMYDKTYQSFLLYVDKIKLNTVIRHTEYTHTHTHITPRPKTHTGTDTQLLLITEINQQRSSV